MHATEKMTHATEKMTHATEKMTHATEKMTAERYLKMIENEDLEGRITNEDINVLNQQKWQLSGDTVSKRIKEVVQKLYELPPDTVCLLPTRNMCDQLNKDMLCSLTGEEIRICSVLIQFTGYIHDNITMTLHCSVK